MIRCKYLLKITFLYLSNFGAIAQFDRIASFVSMQVCQNGAVISNSLLPIHIRPPSKLWSTENTRAHVNDPIMDLNNKYAFFYNF